MTLPELHGWLPASIHARREGVAPSTIRRRAARGAFDVIPNPFGPGALYRAPDPNGHDPAPPRRGSGTTPSELRRAAMSGLGPGARCALAALPASGVEVARVMGLSRGAAHRALRRLERTGFASPDGVVPSGPRGGRPSIVYRAQ